MLLLFAKYSACGEGDKEFLLGFPHVQSHQSRINSVCK